MVKTKLFFLCLCVFPLFLASCEKRSGQAKKPATFLPKDDVEGKRLVRTRYPAMNLGAPEKNNLPRSRRDYGYKSSSEKKKGLYTHQTGPRPLPSRSPVKVKPSNLSNVYRHQPPIKIPREQPEQTSGEQYTHYGFRPFKNTSKDSLSTFSIDVDTASYTIARKKIEGGIIPPPASVRPEEFINYFDYHYPSPKKQPFSAVIDTAPSPFRKGFHLLRIAIQAKRIAVSQRKPANLVFLVDTSGSMNKPSKIDLVKKSLSILVKALQPKDRVSLCTYAGRVAIALPPTSVENQKKILSAIDHLQASGSTSMGQGILLAYNYAMRSYREGGINRVIVCSDGDANVGPQSYRDILKLIGEYKHEGITLTTLGFGNGNYKDTMMEQLANKGNGNYYYIDKLAEAKKIFVDQLGSTLQVLAFDTKLQVEFNPSQVARFRLVGYENRKVAHRDFRNDRVDAGEVGVGQSVTALYEIALQPKTQQKLAQLKSKKSSQKEYSSLLEDLLVLRIRYKPSSSAKSKELSFVLNDCYPTFEDSPQNFRFVCVVGETAEVLRHSPYTKSRLSFVVELAKRAGSSDERKQNFISLLSRAAKLMR